MQTFVPYKELEDGLIFVVYLTIVVADWGEHLATGCTFLQASCLAPCLVLPLLTSSQAGSTALVIVIQVSWGYDRQPMNLAVIRAMKKPVPTIILVACMFAPTCPRVHNPLPWGNGRSYGVLATALAAPQKWLLCLKP